MPSSASFSLFPCLPFELRDMIWKFSLGHIPRSTGELIDPGKIILHPIQRHRWQARAVAEPGHDQHGEEGALTTLKVRYPIRHFQVNQEARAAASAYLTKQERRGVWLEEHSRCANPRRCALFFDWERKALTAPQALDGLVGDALFLSLAEYQGYCESSPVEGCNSSISANGPEPEQQQVVRWGTEWRWNPPGGDIWWSQKEHCANRWPRECDRLSMAMEEPRVALAVPMELLRRDSNTLKNILRWQGLDTRSGLRFTDLVLIVNELPDSGDRIPGEEYLCVEVIGDISRDGWREAAGDIGLSWKDLMRILKAEALAWDFGSFYNILAVRVVPLGSSTVR